MWLYALRLYWYLVNGNKQYDTLAKAQKLMLTYKPFKNDQK